MSPLQLVPSQFRHFLESYRAGHDRSFFLEATRLFYCRNDYKFSVKAFEKSLRIVVLFNGQLLCKILQVDIQWTIDLGKP